MKFIHKKDVENSHWFWCEKNKAPYIVISEVGDGFSRIFFDVTNLNVSLDDLSASLRVIYDAYLRFFMISNDEAISAIDEYYIFSIIVKNEHADFAAESLFDYINSHYTDVR